MAGDCLSIAQNKSLMHLYYTMEINVLLIPTGHSVHTKESYESMNTVFNYSEISPAQLNNLWRLEINRFNSWSTKWLNQVFLFSMLMRQSSHSWALDKRATAEKTRIRVHGSVKKSRPYLWLILKISRSHCSLTQPSTPPGPLWVLS